MNKHILFIFLSCLITSSTLSQNRVSVIPLPAQMNVGEGFFILSPNTQLSIDDASFFPEVNNLQSYIKAIFGNYLSTKNGDNKLFIRKSKSGKYPDSYTVNITKDEIVITAQNNQGLFYALQTLKQIIHSQNSPDSSSSLKLPVLSISDNPAYQWRGLMLDVSRHFFSLEYLKQQIDLLAYYKFNKFHLHLTDDQGWRIEIKKYPELTQKGAWRELNRQDSLCMSESATNPDMALDERFLIRDGNTTLYGGYYTQAELKELIEYAQERHIEIIPEIDMPGHMMAAIKAYPGLSCTGQAAWGKLFSVPLCPCNEEVYTFLENILDEVANLFPSKYIHIGADEVEKSSWKETLICNELMQKEGLQSVDQLQAYFIERIRTYINSKGKEMIVWDDALEGDLSPKVNVMYWRDWVGGVPEKTVNNGNSILFTPGTPFYFSREDSAMYAIYHFADLKRVSDNYESKVLGVQANIWTERIPSENRANHLIYPRLFALAEIGWTPYQQHDWRSFKIRVEEQKKYLKEQNIKYALSSSELIPEMKTDTLRKAILLNFESEKSSPKIYYTLDGTPPSAKSIAYKDPISISHTATICAGIWEDGKILEPLFRRSFDYHKGIGKKVKYITPWNKAYPAGKVFALTDGYRGGDKYNDGYWQGFTSDIEVIIDLEERTEISGFTATFMQLVGSGIYLPESIEISISDDNINYKRILLLPGKPEEDNKEMVYQTFSGRVKSEKTRYIKVYAKNKSLDRFMFTDELIVY